MRRYRVLSLTLLATLTLGGCQSTGLETASSALTTAEDSAASAPVKRAPGECQQSGPGVEALNVSTDTSQAPTISFNEELKPETTERLVIVEGQGPVVAENDRVMVAYAYFNGTTGQKIGHLGYDGDQPAMIPADLNAPYLIGLVHTLLCSSEGSRVAGVIPPLEAFGAGGAPQFGLEPDTSIIFVADIIEVQPPPAAPLERLDGDLISAPEGYPEITYQESGQPDVVIPDGPVPTSYQVATVVAGDGATVYDGAEVVVHYTGINWNTKTQFDSSWDRGEPSVFSTNQVIPGFKDGLVGHTVGSRVLIIIPPALGYGPRGGTPDGRIGPSDTIFFVVDILGIR